MRKRWHVAMVGVAGLTLTLLLPLAMNVASAKSCSGSYCIYEPYGQSGSTARGTGSLITIPSSITLHHTDELIAGSVFLFSTSQENMAIETGVGYGDDLVCGYNAHWTPYATLNNGDPEQNLCTYYLGAGTAWQARAYVSDGTGYSAFNHSNGSPIWTHNWGTYNITGQNYDQTEVHGDGDQPQYGGTMDFENEQWYNGSAWSYWGYTNVQSDCPYVAQWVSNSYWYSYDEVNC